MTAKKINRKTGEKLKRCGIIMPISLQRFGQIEYPSEYWNSLLMFLKDTIKKAGYQPMPMWEDETISTITPRIIKNVLDVELAVCVISSFNPNVMMELGMRLCCRKPVLVIFDEHISSIPFDIKDLEAYQIPSHPIYVQYESIGKKIAEFLHKMDSPGYKTYLDNYAVSGSGGFGEETDIAGRTRNVNEARTKDDRLQSLESRISSLESCIGTNGCIVNQGPTGPSPVSVSSLPNEPIGWLHYVPEDSSGRDRMVGI